MIDPELRILCNKLHQDNINYMITTPAWEFEQSNEIDLICDKNTIEALEACLIRNKWLRSKQQSQNKNRVNYYKLSHDRLLQLDIKIGVNFIRDTTEFSFKDEAILFEKRFISQSDYYYSPRQDDACFLYLCKLYFLERGNIEKRHINNLVNLLNHTKTCDSSITSDIISKFKEDLENARLNRCIIDHEWIKSNLKIHDLFSIKTLRKRTKISKKSHCTILFLGTDGTGKTSLIEAMSKKISCKHATLYLGEKYWRLPFMPNLYLARNKNRLLNFLYYFLMLPIELYCRYASFNRAHSKSRMVLIDRVPLFPFMRTNSKNYNGIKRTLLFLLEWLREKIYLTVLPKMDMVVLLDGDLKIITERKNDSTIEERQHEQMKCKQAATTLSLTSPYVLNTTKYSLQETVGSCINKIFTKQLVREKLFEEKT